MPIATIFMHTSTKSRSHQLNTRNDAIIYSNDDHHSSSTKEVCEHQPVLGFKSKEPFLFPPSSELQFPTCLRMQNPLPDIITQATLEYFYTS